MIEIQVIDQLGGKHTFNGESGQYFLEDHGALTVEIYDTEGEVLETGMFPYFNSVQLTSYEPPIAEVAPLNRDI